MLGEELPHRRRRCLDDKDRQQARGGERLVLRRDRTEGVDVPRHLPDEDLDAFVPAVVLKGEREFGERRHLLDLAIEVREERLDLLLRRVLLGDVQLQGEDLLAQVAREPGLGGGFRFLELEDGCEGSELDEDLGRLRGFEERLADLEALLPFFVVDDVEELQVVQAFDRCFQFIPRPHDQGPGHRHGPKHSRHP